MGSKGGLGKGLGALIPEDSVMAPISQGNLIDIDRIQANPFQPRQGMVPEDLQDLAESIKKHGILQPLLVTYDPGSDQYQLIAGERRLRAAALAGLKQVPVVIRSSTAQECLELALIENIQRADLSPLETAAAYKELMDQFHLTQEEVSERVGKSRVSVTNTLRLLRLPEPVLQALKEGKISEGHARAILGLSSQQSQISCLETVLEHALTVRETEALVQKLQGTKQAVRQKPAVAPEVQEIQNQISTALGTRVMMKHGRNGGTITIYYYSSEELETLLTRFTEK